MPKMMFRLSDLQQDVGQVGDGLEDVVGNADGHQSLHPGHSRQILEQQQDKKIGPDACPKPEPLTPLGPARPQAAPGNVGNEDDQRQYRWQPGDLERAVKAETRRQQQRPAPAIPACLEQHEQQREEKEICDRVESHNVHELRKLGA